MWKGIAVGGAALAIAASAFVVAQAQTQMFQPRPGMGQPGGGALPAVPGAPGTTMLMESEPGGMRAMDPQARRGHGGERMGALDDDARRAFEQIDADDRRAFTEARLAALKAGLALTPEQEKNWPAFEQAAREFAKLRAERRQAWRDWQPPRDPVERLQRQAGRMTETGATLKKLADALDPLYKSFDEGQKRRFAMLSRFSRLLGMEGPRYQLRGEWGEGGRGRMGMHRWGPWRERGGEGERREGGQDRDDNDNSGKQKL